MEAAQGDFVLLSIVTSLHRDRLAVDLSPYSHCDSLIFFRMDEVIFAYFEQLMQGEVGDCSTEYALTVYHVYRHHLITYTKPFGYNSVAHLPIRHRQT